MSPEEFGKAVYCPARRSVKEGSQGLWNRHMEWGPWLDRECKPFPYNGMPALPLADSDYPCCP
jgi:hypothetical protein